MLGGLVEQCDVGLAPAAGLAPEQAALLLAEDGGGRGQQRGGGEEVLEELGGRQLGPQPLDLAADDRVGGDLGGEGGAVLEAEQVLPAERVLADDVGVLHGQVGDDALVEGLAGLVVRQARLAGGVARGGDLLGPQPQRVALVVDRLRVPGHDLAVGDGAGDDPGHDGAALDGGDGLGLGPLGDDAGEQLGGGAQQHVGLGQARQDLGDVAQELGAGADDEHAAALELLAVLVEQVGGAVEGDGGLAGAGGAVDDHDPFEGRADDAVLLGLDGGDDVPHAPGAGGVEGGHERALGADRGTGAVGAVEVEDLVVERGDAPALGVEVAAAPHAGGGGGGGQVEAPARLRAPVDQQLLAALVVEPDAPEVHGAVRGEVVEAAEAQPLLDGVELGDAAAVEVGLGVALRELLLVLHMLAARLVEPGLGRVPDLVEPGVEAVEARLLGLDRGNHGSGHRSPRVRNGMNACECDAQSVRISMTQQKIIPPRSPIVSGRSRSERVDSAEAGRLLETDAGVFW